MRIRSHSHRSRIQLYQTYYPVGSVVSCKFLSAIDGDTVILQDKNLHHVLRVRVRGINCPEMNYDKHDIAPDPFAISAHQYTEYMLQSAENILVEVSEAHYDLFGRLLAHIKADGVCLARSLLKKGLATVCYLETFQNPNLANRFRQGERQGKKLAQKKYNIWSLPNYVRNGKYYVEDVPKRMLQVVGYEAS